MSRNLLALTAAWSVLLFGCEGPAGPGGDEGGAGPTGPVGDDGDDGDDGADGGDGTSPWFTGPGLTIELLSATASGASASVTFRLADAAGAPLDREGRLTEGTVAVEFGIAWLDQAQGQPKQYTAYVTRQASSTITGDTATQATTESSGMIEVVDAAEGTYRYTFATPIDPSHASRTHTVLATASRQVGEARYRAGHVLHFVPGGADVEVTREVVTDQRCGACHGELEGHGGRFRGAAACITCHTGQSSDPDTGNTLDFRVMVHRIHRGAELPSVEGGDPYQIIGFGGSVHDFSTVHFPQEIARCESCHGGDQGTYWKSRTAAGACTSCHDDISFEEPVPEGMVLHSGGTQPTDAPCAVCHPSTGSIAGVADVHLRPAFDPASPVVELELLQVTNAGPGQQALVDFRVLVDGAPRDIVTSPLTRLTATFAGPNSDYARYWQAGIQGGTPGGVLSTLDAGDGRFRFETSALLGIPADATGSFTVGLEGYIQGAARFAAESPTLAFAVTDAVATPRRTIVDTAKCESCHYDLAGHGGGRKGAEYCVLCHNSNNPNDERVAHFEVGEQFVESTDFRVMIHKIHRGEDLSQPYVLGGNPTPNAANPAGTPVDFGETRYPRSTAECSACHDDDSSIEMPFGLDLLPSRTEVRMCTEDPAADANDYCEAAGWAVAETFLVAPETAVCTSCHDAPHTAAHAAVMTSDAGGESCATCHGPGAAQDVSAVHQP